jgi:uncharacterized membrane protein
MDRTLLLLPQNIRPEVLLGYRIPGLGLVLTLVVVIATGVVATNLFGRQLLHLWEAILHRIPVVRGIYGAVKQLTETLFSGSGKSFRKVVLVEYPHANSWTLAFLTGEGGGEIRDKTGKDLLNVFVPTTPNPTSGFFLMVPRERAIVLDMSVEAGLKMLLSVGVVTPGNGKSTTPAA